MKSSKVRGVHACPPAKGRGGQAKRRGFHAAKDYRMLRQSLVSLLSLLVIASLMLPSSLFFAYADDPPASDPPTSNPPTSDPPASDPPASDPPASDPPTSDPPASDPEPGVPELLDNIYQIGTAEELLWFAALVATEPGACAKLTANIDAAAQNWEPIGGYPPYTGSFDGNGKTVTINCQVTAFNYQGYGFFGSLGPDAQVKDLTVSGTVASQISNNVYLGGIAGVMGGGTLQNVSNNATVTGQGGYYTGGIVGQISGGSISNATNKGAVSTAATASYSSAAGIAGFISGSSSLISGCSNDGTISGSGKYTGGIVARATGGSVISSINNGAISSTNASPYLGGIAGGITAQLSSLADNINYGPVSTASASTGALGAVIGYVQGNNDRISNNLYVLGSAERGIGSTSYVVNDGHVKGFLPAGTTALVFKKTSPAKLMYRTGDLFDPAGFTATLLTSDGSGSPVVNESVIGVESVSSWDKTGPLAVEDSEVVLTIAPDGVGETFTIPIGIQVIEVGDLGTLKISQQPSKKLYVEGESFDKDGTVVSALYGEFFNEETWETTVISITLSPDEWTFEPAVFKLGDTKVTVSFTANGITRKADIFNIVISSNNAPPLAADGFYELDSPDDLVWFANAATAQPDVKGRLIADIDTSATSWNGIGGWTAETAYAGVFDGGGHSVTLAIDKPANNYQGLFRYLGGATISNVSVDGFVNAKNAAGGIAGFVMDSTLTNVTNWATITAGGEVLAGGGGVGGIAGSITNTTISAAHNHGAVTANTGGAAGIAYSVNGTSLISGCVNDGRVTQLTGTAIGGTTYPVGGIAGNLNGGTVDGCTNNGDINSMSTAGGIAGSSSGGSTYVKNCSSQGSISGGSVRGAIIGQFGGQVANLENNSYLFGVAPNGLGPDQWTGAAIVVPATAIRVILPDGALGIIVKTSDPTKMQYTIGQYFDPSGFTAAIQYADGSEAPVPADKISCDVSQPLVQGYYQKVFHVDPGIPGVEPVDFTVQPQMQTYLTAMRIKTPVPADKKAYSANTSFNRDDIVLEVYINDPIGNGYYRDLEPSEYSCEPEVFKVGDTSVAFSFTIGTETVRQTVTGFVVTDPGFTTPVADEDGYYPLGSPEALLWFSEFTKTAANAAAKARLTANIDMTGYNYTPIGSSSLRYAGIFDGNGHSINLDIKNGSTFAAVIAYARDATVKNLTVTGSVVIGNGNGAGVVGNADGVTVIENVTNKASVKGSSVAGVVCSYLGTGYIKNCRNEGAVSGSVGAGGIVSQIGVPYLSSAFVETNTSVEGCTNTGSVSGYSYSSTWMGVGGIIGSVGALHFPQVVIKDNVNSGAVENARSVAQMVSVVNSEYYNGVGGIVGIVGPEGTPISGNANYGTVAGPNTRFSYVGGIAGFTMNRANIGTNLSASYIEIGSDLDYDSGLGTADNPFIITQAEQLDALRVHLTSAYRLGGNIDLTAFLADRPAGWRPISGQYEVYQSDTTRVFNGILDGAGFEIRGMWADTTKIKSEYSGLFGRTAADIMNLGLIIDARGLRGAAHTGGIAGMLMGGGSIINCYVAGEGAIIGSTGVGGIAGNSNYGGDSGNTIADCRNDVAVISPGGSQVGGIVGTMDGTNVNNCTNNGDVTGQYGVGGIAGHASGGLSNSHITNNTNNGRVTGTVTEQGYVDDNWAVGGIVGDLGMGYDITVSGNNNNGLVSGSDQIANVGGVIGNVNQNRWDQGVATIEDNNYREDTAYQGIGGNSPQYNRPDNVVTTPAPTPPDPEDPEEPEEPEDPEEPENPEGPEGPEEPGEPGEPEGPTGPNNPDGNDPGNNQSNNEQQDNGQQQNNQQATPPSESVSELRGLTEPDESSPRPEPAPAAELPPPATPEAAPGSQTEPGDDTVTGTEVVFSPIPLGLGFQNMANAVLTITVGFVALAIMALAGFGFWRMYRRRID